MATSVEEFGVLIKAMKAVYTKPEFLPDQAAISVWYALLKDLDYDTLSGAVQKHMMTSPYPPTIADIRAAAAQLTPAPGTGLSELEAWNLVRKAMRNSIYHAEEEFQKLPAAVQKAVGSPKNLEEWAQMDTDTVESVEQSHFIRSYRTTAAREEEMSHLSPVMRQKLADVTRRACIDGADRPEALPGEMEKEE